MLHQKYVIHAQQALLKSGWAENVRLVVEAGKFTAIENGVPAHSTDECHRVVIAGMPNLHSHAFQYAMAGLAEKRGSSVDSFWSWREVMYRFALTMTPEQMQVVALRLYVDMLENGFTRVGEFHYLHHNCDGSQYVDAAEMAKRIISAAHKSGIGLTLLPVFYAHSNFGGLAPIEGQRRFINSIDQFERLLDGCRIALKNLPGAVLGVAPHSLRAVTPEELNIVIQMLPEAPVHIHVAEQVKEVEDCLVWSGKRPVEWLLDNVDLSDRWCLIHATHINEAETKRMAKAGAIAGLCPITEANLGDGTFNASIFMQAGGKFGIGSDSNVLIGLADELRQLEYSQRLQHRSRNVMAIEEGSTGRSLFDSAIAGGNIAMGVCEQGLEIGASADIVALDTSRLTHAKGNAVLDAMIFANRAKPAHVWVRGIKQVENGRHHLHEQAEVDFQRVLRELLEG